jgi:hypothetical protein
MRLYSDDAVIRWKNEEELFEVEDSFSIGNYTVPKGFKTDLASIPRWATPLVPKLGHHLQPAIVHDWMYVTKLPGVSKADADKLFYTSMLAQGVRKTRAMLMYSAVRVGGKGRWV